MKSIHHEAMSMFEAYSASGNTMRETDISKLVSELQRKLMQTVD